MRYNKNPMDILTKLLLFLISAGFLYFLTSCAISLRDVDAPPQREIHEPPDLPNHISSEDEISEPSEKLNPEEVTMDSQRKISSEALEWIEWYDETYGMGASDKLISTREQIAKLNQRMTQACPTMRAMADFAETLSGAELREMIEKYKLPSDKRYSGGDAYISDCMLNEISLNRNLAGIENTVEIRCAVVTDRCSLKGFPTDTSFHKHGDRHYDNIQETELIAGWPIMVAHTSLDEKYIFVLSYFYSGWIPADFAAYCTAEEYELFASPEAYVTITSKSVDCGGIRYDMGATLPYLSEDDSSFQVLLPKRSVSGTLYLEEAGIAKIDAVYGSLEYTMKNYYAQAFSYLGTYYGWGGADGGVDCSGFVCAVFRTFGIYLPRNTGEQSKIAGEIIPFTSTALDAVQLPAAIYRPGHVMLYLGKKSDTHYIIHAPKGGEQVCVAPLSPNPTSISIIK